MAWMQDLSLSAQPHSPRWCNGERYACSGSIRQPPRTTLNSSICCWMAITHMWPTVLSCTTRVVKAAKAVIPMAVVTQTVAKVATPMAAVTQAAAKAATPMAAVIRAAVKAATPMVENAAMMRHQMMMVVNAVEAAGAGAVAVVTMIAVATMIAMMRRLMMMAAKAVEAAVAVAEVMTIATAHRRMMMVAKAVTIAMMTADPAAIMDLKDRRNRRDPISARKKSVT